MFTAAATAAAATFMVAGATFTAAGATFTAMGRYIIHVKLQLLNSLAEQILYCCNRSGAHKAEKREDEDRTEEDRV